MATAAVGRPGCVAMSPEGRPVYLTNQELQAALITVPMSFPGALFPETDLLGNYNLEGCLANTDCFHSPFAFRRAPIHTQKMCSHVKCFGLALFLDYSPRKAEVLSNLLHLSQSLLWVWHFSSPLRVFLRPSLAPKCLLKQFWGVGRFKSSPLSM